MVTANPEVAVNLREIRLRCLEIASKTTPGNYTSEWLVGEARKLEEYVLGGG